MQKTSTYIHKCIYSKWIEKKVLHNLLWKFWSENIYLFLYRRPKSCCRGININVYLVIFHCCPVAKAPPTSGTNVSFLCRVGGNVRLKLLSGFKFFTAKCARKSGRVLGMLNFHVMRYTIRGQVSFSTSEKSAWKTRSFFTAVDGNNVSA